MMTFIDEAGWFAWPILLFGAVSLAVTIRYAMSPRRELFMLVVGFGVATILLGLLGTATALQITARHVPAEQPWLLTVGFRESMNNIVLALGIASLDALIATIGAYRGAKLLVSVRQPAV